MMKTKQKKRCIRIIASDKSWIEGEAVRQLDNYAKLPGMKACIGLPDLHPGRGTPIGAVFFNDSMIYPYIIGNDVGCGIGLWQTSLKTSRIKRDKWVKKLKHLNNPWDGDSTAWLQDCGLESSGYDSVLGTIGSGNHFAELQRVETVFCQKSFTASGLDDKKLFLLVHSGSRGIGEALLRRHTSRFGAEGLPEENREAKQYLEGHDFGIRWAKCSRSLIAKRFVKQLGTDCSPVLDLCHNGVERVVLEGVSGWLHRKGAASSDRGMLVIPGSRGSLSYLVIPTGDQSSNLWSLAHGAGRKWNRKSCKDRLKPQFSAESLSRTALGSIIICEDKELLYQEAPQAYKNIARVISDMEDEGLIQVVATFRPVITYKRRKTP